MTIRYDNPCRQCDSGTIIRDEQEETCGVCNGYGHLPTSEGYALIEFLRHRGFAIPMSPQAEDDLMNMLEKLARATNQRRRIEGMTDMTTILTCDECGLHYRAGPLPHKCADWTKGRERDSEQDHEQNDRPEQAGGGDDDTERLYCLDCHQLASADCIERDHETSFCEHEHDAPAAPERDVVSDQWGYRQRTDDEWEVENDMGVIVAVSRRELWARWITQQHNQHSTLVAQRERLAAALRQTRNAAQVFTDSKHLETAQAGLRQIVNGIDSVLTTIGQEGTEGR